MNKIEANEKCAEFVRRIWQTICDEDEIDLDASDIQVALEGLGLLNGVMPEGAGCEDQEKYVLIDALR